ncbi:MAG: guanylate kinase [Cryomorphaceae bacterium]|nr:guanylate kinase [Cryomorphaceae bacterium]
MSGKMLILSAPSGSGKTTLVKHLLTQRSDLLFSISATTRAPRGKEVHGKDYYFLSVQAFEEKIAEDAFVEYEQVYPGRYYGTLKSEVQRIFNAGSHVVFDIDVQGGVNIKRQFPENSLSIFIQPPTIEALQKRLMARGTDSESEIEMRVAKAQEEMAMANRFDYVLVNDDLERAKKEIAEIVNDFICR